jgi:hypothetical protein
MNRGISNQDRLNASVDSVKGAGGWWWLLGPVLAGLCVSIPLYHLLMGKDAFFYYRVFGVILQDILGMTDNKFLDAFGLSPSQKRVTAAYNLIGFYPYRFWSVAATQVIITVGLIAWNPFGRKRKFLKKNGDDGVHLSATPRELAKEIKKSPKVHGEEFSPTPFDFHVPGFKGLRIPEPTLATMLGVVGDSGSGKSVFLRQFVASRRATHEKCFVIDMNGEYSSRFYKPGDVILSLFDKRAAKWSPWEEGLPMEEVASAILEIQEQQATSSTGDFFNTASHVVLTSLLHATDSPESLWELATLDRETLVKVLSEMPGIAKQMVGKGTDGQTLGVIATALRKLAAFEHLGKHAKAREAASGKVEEYFSISKWVNNPSDRRNVFIVSTDRARDQSKALFRIWISTLTNTLMARHEGANADRIYLIADELDTVGRIPKLAQFLTTMRRKNGRAVLGFHSPDQLVANYGEVHARLIMKGFQNLVIFRFKDTNEAKKMAEYFGKVEVIEHTYSHSIDRKTYQPVASTSETIKEKWVVSPDFIAKMIKGQAILRLADFSPCVLRFQEIEYPQVTYQAAHFEEIPENKEDYKKVAQLLKQVKEEKTKAIQPKEHEENPLRTVEGASAKDAPSASKEEVFSLKKVNAAYPNEQEKSEKKPDPKVPSPQTSPGFSSHSKAPSPAEGKDMGNEKTQTKDL